MIERMVHVDLRLWPASPTSPQVAFDMDLLDFIHAAMMECQVSIHHACNLLIAEVDKGCVVLCWRRWTHRDVATTLQVSNQ